MKPYRASASTIVEAPAELVYRTLADYREGHPSILPKSYFISLEVEQGGFGAGTIINFQMRVLGKTQTFRAAITEPEPGRVLVERNLGEGVVVTTFIVEPRNDGTRTEVTIDTEGVTRGSGPLGSVERLLTTMFLRRIYKEELKQLARVCEGTPRRRKVGVKSSG
jgi:polyketide cyclase/dehydrase/lipid transport protein